VPSESNIIARTTQSTLDRLVDDVNDVNDDDEEEDDDDVGLLSGMLIRTSDGTPTRELIFCKTPPTQKKNLSH
jgi:hypothetical protein